MSKEEIIKNIIQAVLDVNAIEITNSAHLIHDLGASEVQLSEIANRIEQSFSIILGFESFDMTVEDLMIVVFSELSEASRNLANEPRSTHLSFAYQVLPALAFLEGINLFWDLRYKRGHDYMQGVSLESNAGKQNQPSKQGLEYLSDLWKGMSKNLGKEELEPLGLDYEVLEKTNRLIALFRFPEPEAIGEAYYSLFVWDLSQPVDAAARYFTLELAKENETQIGEWSNEAQHTVYEHYTFIFTPRQFLDVVLKSIMPHEDRNILDEKRTMSSQFQFKMEGEPRDEHIYIKIIQAVAHKLNVESRIIDRNTYVQNLGKQDMIDVISEVYRMYDIDPAMHYLFIKQDVDDLIKSRAGSKMDCRSMIYMICKHFEKRIAGDYDNPKSLYLDYRKKIDILSQSPDFRMLYTFISKTYPSFITDNADQKILDDRDLLYKEVLSIPEKQLSHNYPVNPRGLFICLTAVAMAYAKYSHSPEKVAGYYESALALNTKWGPFMSPEALDKAIHKPLRKVSQDGYFKKITHTIYEWLK
jgi:hypothetical protein